VRGRTIAAPLLRAVIARLGFLIEVGLDYLTLDRSAMTLSGGEGQRIRLATQIGAALVGVLYVLDEPSVGLHARDNTRLIEALRALVDLGNSVLVVEHDRETILKADHVIDMGPGAGEHGGTVVAAGAPAALLEDPKSVTGPYLALEKRLYAAGTRRRKGTGFIEIKNARANNLRGLDVKIPVGVITAVTGVSGSGKSSLITDTLLPAARKELYRSSGLVGACDGVRGLDQFDKVISIDQGLIGRTPRSNPATYTGVFSMLRDLFAGLPEARARGYKSGRFSFNVKGGRCEACQGDGVLRVEMHFLPDIFVECETCGGKRYNRETLEVLYRGRSVADVLDLTVDEALVELEAVPRVRELLAALSRVGLGYVRLGQPATTLSGGEAQRVKLARELARRATGRTLYVFDEPTTGLHFQDIELLLVALQGLADAGNTVIVVEHNLELVANADWVIDLGPEGGERGGQLIASGTPEAVAACEASHTGHYLDEVLRGGGPPRSSPRPKEETTKPQKRPRAAAKR
jgi:excinuclease ABC subunit A